MEDEEVDTERANWFASQNHHRRLYETRKTQVMPPPHPFMPPPPFPAHNLSLPSPTRLRYHPPCHSPKAHQHVYSHPLTAPNAGMPDALSTTIPVWCAVLNRVLLPHHPLSQELHLPPHLLPSTHAQVSALLPAFADSLRALRLGDALPRCLTKPLRPLWVTQDSALRFRDEDVDVGNDADEGVDGRDDDGDGDGDGVEVVDEEGYDHSGSGAEEQEEEQEEEEDDDDGTLFQDYRPVICLTASKRILAGTEADAGGYIQGAADDTENWAHGLTPSLFWAHTAELLSAPDDALPDLIASLVASASFSFSIPPSSSPAAATSTTTTTAGTASFPPSSSSTTPLITTHRLTPQISVCALPLGAPAPPSPAPAPKDSADARRGPTTCHIALGGAPTPKDTWVRSPTYMNVGLGKNKTAARNLRLALPEICSFAVKFLEKGSVDDRDGSGAPVSELKGQERTQIIIGCESGRDLSIGAALALSCYLFDDEGRFRAPTEGASFTKTLVKIRLGGIMTAYPECNPSRQTLQSINSFLMDWRN